VIDRTADVFIEGEGIHLRGLRQEDLAGNWYRWFNDPEVTYLQDKGYRPNTLELQTQYYERIQASETDVVLAIVEAAGGRHIGNVGLHDIRWIHRTANLGIVIGEKEFWGKGYGREAWRLITAHGFETLHLNKINAVVLAGNDRSLACARAAGFVHEGTQAQQYWKHGEYRDAVLLGVTRAAWVGSTRR